MGFSFPFDKWLRNSDYIKEIANTKNVELTSNYNKFIQGKLHWSSLMSLIILNHRKII